MAGTQGGKTSQLQEKTELNGEEYLMIQEGNTNRKAKVKNLGLHNPEAKVSVVQTTGTSTTDVMSQDSVTKELQDTVLIGVEVKEVNEVII